MTINLVVTSEGFRCATDDDFEKKRRLKNGKVVECSIKEYRNYKFLKLFFALIDCSWEFLGEWRQEFFHNDKDAYRETLTIAAGYYEPFYSPTRQEWLEKAKSIAFDKMDETEFSELYERVKDVIYKVYIPNDLKDEFEQQLKYF